MFITDPDFPTTPSGLAFTGNPIIMRCSSVYPSQPVNGYQFDIDLARSCVYSGRYNYPYSINIADIVEAYTPCIADPGMWASGDPLITLEDEADIYYRTFTVSFQGVREDSLNFIAIPGGISRQNFRQINNSEQDIFTVRFLADNTNCFFTTRTHGWRIFMKETEVYPLCFITDYENDFFVITERVSGKSLTVPDIPRGIHALDIEAVRYQFFEQFGILASVFDIDHRNRYACRIIIEQSDSARERYRLKFRNSLGVFEIIELSGEMQFSPEWATDEDATYNVYDPANDNYLSARDRIERRQKITISTGVKRPDEISFLMDMFGSDEVYLLELTDLPVKVIPSAEDITFNNRTEVPQSFTISLIPAEVETFIMPPIVNGTEFGRQRIFSNEFSKEFN